MFLVLLHVAMNSSLQKGKRSERSGTHSSGKEFVFDHSYWSVNGQDSHFVGQERVSCHMHSS